VRLVRKSPIMCDSDGDFATIRIRKRNSNLLARDRVCVPSQDDQLYGTRELA